MDKSSTQEDSTPDIKFNVDDFDLENYNFEPLTEGLGFNSQNRKKENIVVKRQEPVQESKPVLRREDFEKRVTTVSNQGLSSFYRDSKLSDKGIKTKKRSKKFTSALVEASMELKLVAWLIDLIVVSSLFVATIAACALLVSIPLNMATLKSLGTEIYIYLGVIYSCFYLFYFTVFDLQKTFGKYLLGIKTYSISNEEISIKQSFIRSFISLVSLILLGFPLVLDFQGKLSDTKVCMN